MPTLQEYEKRDRDEAIWVGHPLEGIDSTPWHLLAAVRQAEIGFDRPQSKLSRASAVVTLRDANLALDAWYEKLEGGT